MASPGSKCTQYLRWKLPASRLARRRQQRARRPQRPRRRRAAQRRRRRPFPDDRRRGDAWGRQSTHGRHVDELEDAARPRTAPVEEEADDKDSKKDNSDDDGHRSSGRNFRIALRRRLRRGGPPSALDEPERGVDLVLMIADVASFYCTLDGFSGGAGEGGARHLPRTVGIGGDGRGGAAVVEAPRPRHVARGRVVPAVRRTV